MKRQRYFLLSIIFFFLFIILTLILKLSDFFYLYDSFVGNLFSWNYFLISAVSFLGSPLFTLVVLFAFFLFFHQKYRREISFLWILGLGAVFQFFLKRILAFERPENSLIITPGFPSGHSFYSALVYWTLAGLLWKKSRSISIIFMVIPFIIALTRLQLGVHWFSDVLGGLLFGAGWIFLYFYLLTKK